MISRLQLNRQWLNETRKLQPQKCFETMEGVVVSNCKSGVLLLELSSEDWIQMYSNRRVVAFCSLIENCNQCKTLIGKYLML